MPWVFENVVMLMETMVMDHLTTLVNENKNFHYLTKLNISRNTVSWVFENVVIATITIVLKYLLTLVKRGQMLSLYKQG